jgi:hypothetical protein
MKMSQTDDRDDKSLPVTGEVGSEGGSYADPTVQVPTFKEDLGRIAENAEPGKVQSGPEDVIRYPNERED